MYHHPGTYLAELGLEGKWGRVAVWLFGTEWKTDPVKFTSKHWYSISLTWSHTKDRPALYIDGTAVELKPGGWNGGNKTKSGILFHVFWPVCMLILCFTNTLCSDDALLAYRYQGCSFSKPTLYDLVMLWEDGTILDLYSTHMWLFLKISFWSEGFQVGLKTFLCGVCMCAWAFSSGAFCHSSKTTVSSLSLKVNAV